MKQKGIPYIKLFILYWSKVGDLHVTTLKYAVALKNTN